jgi:hypothetical protein
MRGRHRETGELHERQRPLCDQHYDDLMTPCAADGCDRQPDVAVKIVGTSAHTGEPAEDEVRFCDVHWHEFQQSRTVTIDGITMVHDGHGNLKRLPMDMGQG